MLAHSTSLQEMLECFRTTAVRRSEFKKRERRLIPPLGHYIENTSETEDLVWIELYKSDRVKDISLAQWLALTPSGIVSSILKIPVEVAESLKKEKQVLIA
jgi:oxalate decarboxylase/phosphoglucose isomerase-like protein (cupin superfamily)